MVGAVVMGLSIVSDSTSHDLITAKKKKKKKNAIKFSILMI